MKLLRGGTKSPINMVKVSLQTFYLCETVCGYHVVA
jgi:hypothetical protein